MQVKQLAAVLESQVTNGTPLESAVGELESFLKARGAEAVLPSVLKVLLRKLESRAGAHNCKIEVAHETSDELLASIAETLGGSKFEATVNPELIGGFTALYNHQLIDASTKRHITQLEQSLS